jgi:hypothetical protein
MLREDETRLTECGRFSALSRRPHRPNDGLSLATLLRSANDTASIAPTVWSV